MPRTSVISAFINDNASGAVGPDGTQYYVELTVQSSQVSSDLTNFPVYVDLSDMPAAFFTNVQSDGGDIRVTESDGLTRCPVDLVAIDTGASTGELHFLASSVSSSSNTTFRIYYDAGGGLSQPGVATTYGRNAVWGDYKGVWHLDEDPSGTAPQFVDSTGNGLDGTTQTAMVPGDSVSGALGQGVEFDGSTEFVDVGTGFGIADNATATLQSWVKPDTTAAPLAVLSSNTQVLLRLDGSGQPQIIFNNFTLNDRATASSALSTSSFSLLHGMYDGTDIVIYVNGSAANTVTPTGSYAWGTGEHLIGAFDADPGPIGDDTQNFMDGVLDEIRIKSGSLSADWVAAEYTNQNTPTTFYTIGSQTTV